MAHGIVTKGVPPAPRGPWLRVAETLHGEDSGQASEGFSPFDMQIPLERRSKRTRRSAGCPEFLPLQNGDNSPAVFKMRLPTRATKISAKSRVLSKHLFDYSRCILCTSIRSHRDVEAPWMERLLQQSHVEMPPPHAGARRLELAVTN